MRILISTQEYNKSELSKEGILLNVSLNTIDNTFGHEKGLQIDTETTMTKTFFDKDLLLLQLGTIDKKHQIVFDVNNLPDGVEDWIIKVLSSDVDKYIQNSLFEYIVIKHYYGVDINNLKDTYVQSRLLKLGLIMPKGYHGLAGIQKRIFDEDIDKSAQTTFHSGILTVDQINYALDDVVPMYAIYEEQNEVIEYYNLEVAVWLKCEAIRCYGDIMSKSGGLVLNQDQWLKRNDLLIDELKVIKEDLDSIILEEPFFTKCCELGYIQAEDHWEFKWGSPKFKKELFKLIYPDIQTTSKPAMSKMLLTETEVEPIEFYINREFDKLEKYFITRFPDELEAMGMFTPAGTITINWGSTTQRLEVFQIIYPDLESTGKDAIAKLSGDLIDTYKKYSVTSKAVSSYGIKFIENNVDADGKVRPHDIDFFLNTGRTAVGALMTIPANNVFRNCFYPSEGNVFVDADYNSLELAIIANLSKETKWLECIKKGKDLHSTNCGIMFGQDWIDHEGHPDEEGFFSKPVTAWGKQKRQFSKTLSFGLA